MIDPTLPLEQQALDTAPIIVTEEKEKKRNPSWIKPGEIRNPNGRPKKGFSITERVKEMLNSDPERKDRIINKILDAAEAGDLNAAKLAWNYMDGMPMQATDITSLGEKLEAPRVSIDSKPNENT